MKMGIKDRICESVELFIASFDQPPKTIWVGLREWKEMDCLGGAYIMGYLGEKFFCRFVVVPTQSESCIKVSSFPHERWGN